MIKLSNGPTSARKRVMKAELLKTPADVSTNPLVNVDIAKRTLATGHLLVKIDVCAVCHTDLHVVEGELPNIILPIIPGHQIVGSVVECGEGVTRFMQRERVGIFWLHWACGVCEFCKRGEE